jgi:hypothetical protein
VWVQGFITISGWVVVGMFDYWGIKKAVRDQIVELDRALPGRYYGVAR